MTTRDERLAKISVKLDELSKKAAAASEETKAARELREAAVRDKIKTVKGDVIAMEERIRLAEEQGRSKLSANLLKIQMKLRAKIQDHSEALDKRMLERYIDDRMNHIADVFETIDYLMGDARLSMLEAVAAMDEYNAKYGETVVEEISIEETGDAAEEETGAAAEEEKAAETEAEAEEPPAEQE